MIANWDSLSCYGQPPGEYKTQGLMQTADPMPVWIPGAIFMEWNHKLLFHTGWKIHISVDPVDADDLARLALPVLRLMQVHHKVIGPWVDYERFNRESPQRGKFITVYPGPSASTAQRVLDRLDTIIEAYRFRGGPVPVMRSSKHTEPEIPIGVSGLFFCLWSDDYSR
jgi:hypothetical protein